MAIFLVHQIFVLLLIVLIHPCLEHSVSYSLSDHEWDQDRDYFDSRPQHLMMVLVNSIGSFLRNGPFLVLFLHFLNVT